MFALLQLIPFVGQFFKTVESVSGDIANVKVEQLHADTDDKKIASGERIVGLTAQRDVLIEESKHSKANIIVRGFLASGPIAYLDKIYVWDKVVGSIVGCSGHTEPGTCGAFTTDELTPDQWHVVWIVLGFYFCYEISQMWKKS